MKYLGLGIWGGVWKIEIWLSKTSIMRYRIFFILILPFLTGSTYAQQLDYGAVAGFNLSGAIVKDPGGNPKGTPLPGFQLGGYVSYQLPSPHLAIAANLLFSYEGYQPDIYDTKANVRVSFLKIPLNLVYKPLLKDNKWSIGLGPYFGFGIGGHYKTNGGNQVKINFGSNGNVDDLKRMDLGMDLLAAYQVDKNISIRAAFDYGLIDYLTPGSSQNASAHCLNLGITGSYRLAK